MKLYLYCGCLWFGLISSSLLFCYADSNSTANTTDLIPAPPTNSVRNYGKLANTITYFSNHLKSIIDGKDNIFFSPFSISVSLGMIYLGARGETAKAMEESLGYKKFISPESPEIIHGLFQSTINSLESVEDAYSLEVANGIFIQEGFNVSPEYARDLKNFYTAKVLPVDFKSEGEATVTDINNWVNNHTGGMIEQLFDEPLDTMTILLLVNAIYFKGFWKEPFNEKLTTDMNFYMGNGNIKRVPFMQNRITVLSFHDDSTNYTFLELDYMGEDISMVFALPYDREQFPDLEITTTMMCRVRSNFRSSKMQIVIPKFKIAYERELSEDLFHLGLGELFNEDHANLTGIRHEDDLYVSAMVHKAVIEVNEQGTEASAGTGVTFYVRSGHTRYSFFKADHPFIFAILDKRSGTLLFLGRVVEP